MKYCFSFLNIKTVISSGSRGCAPLIFELMSRPTREAHQLKPQKDILFLDCALVSRKTSPFSNYIG